MNTIWLPDLSQATGPKYQQLIESIRAAIVSKQLQPGEKLPPVRELAWQLQVTPGTVARAYRTLVDQAVLSAAVGRGTYVAEPVTPPALPENPDMVDLSSPVLPDMGQDALIRSCYARMAQESGHNLTGYPGQNTEQGAKQAVYKWLSGADLGPYQADDITLTHGAQNAIMMVLQTTLQDPDPVILTEDLSYAGFRNAARLLRARIVGLKMDEGGIVPQSYEDACKAYGPQVLCTSPGVNNPTTCSTGLQRRQDIAGIARKYGGIILEDDSYFLESGGLPSYRALLPQQSYYVSSLSKPLTPSLRVGFALGPVGQCQKLQRTARYNHFGLALSVTDLAERVLNAPELPRIRVSLIARVNEYLRMAVNVLGSFDLKWREGVPFLWLKLPRNWRASNFCMAVEKQGVRLRSADDFALLDGRAPHAVRITINGRVRLDDFEAALFRIEKLLRNPPDSIGL
ncbi:MAG: aspartate aminotransferase [Rhodobacterales bacterium]|nr:MAG: aspartate aminotransferase [Rhodobacterales bacterium]